MKFTKLKVLELQSPGSFTCCNASDGSKKITLELKGQWSASELQAGDTINVCGSMNDGETLLTVSDTAGYLVLNPDLLVSVTILSDVFQCQRRAVLNSKISQYSVSSVTLYGTMLHEVIQSALAEMKFDTQNLNRYIDLVISDQEDMIQVIGDTAEMAREKLRSYLPAVKNLYSSHIQQQQQQQQRGKFQIQNVADIEENIWSVNFGLKGKIDATVSLLKGNQSRKVVPLEIKSGRRKSTHNAQVLLYCLMLGDHYAQDVAQGLLYYAQNPGEMVEVSMKRPEIIAIIMARNELSRYLDSKPGSGATDLPPVKQSSQCEKCYAVDICSLYHRARKEQVQFHNVNLYNEKTAHLNERDLKFFNKWNNLIDLEEASQKSLRKQIWTQSVVQRESNGKCLSSLQIQSNAGQLYTFKSSTGQALYAKLIDVGDQVVLSSMNGQYGIAQGVVTEVTSHSVTALLDREFDKFKRKFVSAVKQKLVLQDLSHQSKRQKIDGAQQVLYRLDREEVAMGHGIARFNLANLFTVSGDSQRRQLIMGEKEPQFSNVVQSVSSNSKQLHLVDGLFKSLSLNDDQQSALMKVLTAQDYALILGMPGCGKSTTIVDAIELLLTLGKSILITSFTHSAVDNILVKMAEKKVDFVRLGSVDKVHVDVQKFVTKNYSTVQSAQLVGMTCLSTNSPLIQNRTFDYCIVDEASQIPLPVCLGPLRFASKFILVGDPDQLPPLIQSEEARKGGMEQSLFEYLYIQHPQAASSLKIQYRMNEDIMYLCNNLVYKNQLTCGSQQVASRQLQLDYSKIDKNTPKWLQAALDPRRGVIFFDTDQVPGNQDELEGEGTVNKLESSIISHLCREFTDKGVKESDIGVISPFKSQVKLIKRDLHSAYSLIEVSTVDKYQGRDKECIIVSFVKSNQDLAVGELLKDERRLNVALTRAKSKLILIGSRSTLSSYKLFQDLFELLSVKQWVYQLDGSCCYDVVPIAKHQHCFDEDDVDDDLYHAALDNIENTLQNVN
ncbi:hypothetical protein MP228_001719 [Amoeboaphelidium protococcarum]|nr:hypothetical protein MP228_001719 [Amoeboaphelidium protococcarum]